MNRVQLVLVILILTLSACTNTAENSAATQTLTTSEASLASGSATAEPLHPSPTSTPLPSLEGGLTSTVTVEVESQEQGASPTPTETLDELAEDPTPTPTEEVDDQEQTPSPTPTETPAQPTPTPEPTPEETPPSPGECTDKAAFYGDVTVPDRTVFRQGDDFVKTWKLRNEGTCTWTDDYAAVFAFGDLLASSEVSPLPESVAPGGIVEISVPMVAPGEGGDHIGNWQLRNAADERFGVGITGNDYFWVHIVVSHVPPTPDTPDDDGEVEPTPPAPGECEAERNTAFEAQVLTLVNTARANGGLNKLNRNGSLNAAALAHSTDMACNDFVDHTGSDGSTWFDRIAAQGYAYSAATENIYVGSPEFGGTPQGAFDWWWNSQIHHDNIMDPDVTEIGIGYVFNAESTYGGYYTLVFASRE